VLTWVEVVVVEATVEVVVVARVVEVVELTVVSDFSFSLFESVEFPPVATERISNNAQTPPTTAVMIHLLLVVHALFIHTRAKPIGAQHRSARTTTATLKYQGGTVLPPEGGIGFPLGGGGALSSPKPFVESAI
jgi:hypothetical protein